MSDVKNFVNTGITPPSACVSVFPIAKNRVVNGRQQRLLYEDNIANLIRQLSDACGFVISTGENAVKLFQDEDGARVKINNLAFNLYGYYFSISASNTVVELPVNLPQGDNPNPAQQTVYLNAQIMLNSHKELDGQDQEETYTGLLLSLSDTSIPKNDNFITDNTVVEGETITKYKIQSTLGAITYRYEEQTLQPGTYIWNLYFDPVTVKFNLKSFEDSIEFIDGKR